MNRRLLGLALVALIALVAAGVVAAVDGDPFAGGHLGAARAAAGGGRMQAGDGPSGSLSLPAGTPQAVGAEDAAPYDPCPSYDGAIPGEGPSTAAEVTIPSVPPKALPAGLSGFEPGPGDLPADFQGAILRPTDTARYPGPRPVVVLFHGISGDQCQMWWLAQWLSGAGYTTLILTSPTPPARDPSYGVAIDAARSALDFLRDPVANPFAFATDSRDVGMAGWSEGSIVVSLTQGMPSARNVRAVVALDDLRGSLEGDSGAPLTFCSPPVRGRVTPRVPALGFASDTICDTEPGDDGSGIKLSGFDVWRSAGVPAVELPLAGYSHYDYDLTGPRLVPVAELTLAWFDAWLEGSRSALQTFTSCQLDGEPTVAALASRFRAAAYLPSIGVDSTDWGRTLAARCHEDPSLIGSQPIP